MIKHFINNSDKRYIFLKGPAHTMIKMEEYFNKIPAFMFMPSYRLPPKAEVHLDSFMKGNEKIWMMYSGLLNEAVDWCTENKIETTLNKDLFKVSMFHDFEEFKDIVSKWGLKFPPYPYQLEAAYNILKYSQSLSEIATRAGKTLIGYMVFRYAREWMDIKKILMICPSIFLVKQGHADFSEYADFFKAGTVWAKGEMVDGGDLVIGTFQSLVKRCDPKSPKYDPAFFEQFDCVLVDEVHNAKAQSIKNILTQPFMKNVRLRFGFSGTLPLKGTLESYCVQELMGGKIQDITPKELIDGGYISDINIKQYRISYPEIFGEDCNKNLRNIYKKCAEYLCFNYDIVDGKKVLLDKGDRFMSMIHKKSPAFIFKQLQKGDPDVYLQHLLDTCKAAGSNLLTLENYVTHFSEKKLNIIKDIVKQEDKGNIILFFHYNAYCSHVHKILKEEFPDRQVVIMTGSTNIKSREAIKDMMKNNDNVVLCANYGVSSTGLTLRLDAGIFVESFKSHVIVKQSAGRGLCLDEGKTHFQLYDLIDCLPTKRIFLQGKAKCKIYEDENFTHSIIKK